MNSRQRIQVACLGGVALLLVACGGGSGGGSAESADVAQGHELFRSTCATCHGPDAEGMPRLGKNLHENAFVQGKSDEELLKFLKEGRPATHPDNERGVDMPPKGGNPALTDEDLKEIIVYIRSIS
ncbi:MAG: cytochrome c [Thermoanaerobaculia bacterium]